MDVTGAPAVVEDPPRLAVLHAWAEKMAKDVSSREGVVEVAEGSINLTTAAGMLLGYPIVYWYQVNLEWATAAIRTDLSSELGQFCSEC